MAQAKWSNKNILGREFVSNFNTGDQVHHKRHGIGSVILDEGSTVVIRFDHGIESCEKADIQIILQPIQAAKEYKWDNPLEVITKIQAEAIQTVNATWGVFALSKIALLPHQLWVCRRVQEQWPARWLVADDVGLGKTIEAGLILSPLIARGRARRILIICPASLVRQWQERLFEMFDLRFTVYRPESDTDTSHFWEMNDQVIVSLQTLRADSNNRHTRFFAAEPWDLIMVDEAHHINANEHDKTTLGYTLIERLEREKRVQSMIFFTGTPHRGKNYSFLALLKLLRPDLFDPQKSFKEQLPNLRKVMIRNNKQNVTDLNGKRLFKEPIVKAETYEYSQAEADFYRMMTEFILTGKTYAASLTKQTQGQAVMLVLIALQKLASSSVAAVRKTLKRRLSAIQEQSKVQSERIEKMVAQYKQTEEQEDLDQVSIFDETIAEVSLGLKLMEDEKTQLQKLVEAANLVKEETKIAKIMAIVKEKYPDKQILFFTEYKATQALLMSALQMHFGDGCVAFINGDEFLEEVTNTSGRTMTIREKRQDAVAKFNSGKVRFLISTEAGGEGIDLQERCHTLIHVDLPWNPMRLHQRVGRLNRYGQTKQVEVITVRNPDTVESAIWDKLNHKIAQINLALQQVMDDPEDMLQLVLGMTSPNIFREMFGTAHDVAPESLSHWFDEKTARFGGEDAIDTVKALVGNSARFDFQQVAHQIPKLDLPALRPFLLAMLTLNQRQIKQSGDGKISFLTPLPWLENEPAIKRRYDNMTFERTEGKRNKTAHILGVGHKLMDKALAEAQNSTARTTILNTPTFKKPLFIFKIQDQVTDTSGIVRTSIIGIEVDTHNQCKLLLDWELLKMLNDFTTTPSELRRLKQPPPQEQKSYDVEKLYEECAHFLESKIDTLELPFKVPIKELWAILLPVDSDAD